MSNLYISNTLPPYRVDLCNELHERLGCEICHYWDGPGDACFSQEELAARSHFDNRIVPVRRILGKAILRDPAKLIGEDPRVVFVNEFSPIALQMLSLRRKYGFKVVSFCDDSMDMIRGNDFSAFHSFARKYVPQYIDEIVLHSPDVLEWYRERFGKGILMPIIADDILMRERLKKVGPLSEEYRRRYGLEGKKVILFVGRLVGLKNLPRLFEAFSRLKNIARMVVVGDGTERVSLESLSRSSGLDVVFAGARFGEELLAWYNLADVLALPSTREAFGAVTGEALTCGCRVLVSCKAGSSSLVREGYNGFVVDPYDSGSIGDTIARLLDMPSIPRDASGIRPSLLPVSFADSISDILAL